MPGTPPTIPFAGCFTADGKEERCHLAFLGLPDDSQSSYRRGCSLAPHRIRLAYDGNCYNGITESGIDLTAAVADLGDLPSQSTWTETADHYRETAKSLFVAGKVPFFAGGDHAVTVPVVEALAVLGQAVHVIHIDAHPDLYPEYEGSRTSHACAACRILEMDHVASLTQLGIRTMNAVQQQQADRFGDRLHVRHARDLPGAMDQPAHIPPGSLVYLTVDLDGFDPAFAPGVSHPVPGGLTPRQVLNFLQVAKWRLVGMDVVEVNTERDVNDLTAILAGRILHEGMGRAGF